MNSLANNLSYSERFAQLAQLQQEHAAMRQTKLDLQDEKVEPCMRQYGYPVSAWPVIISQKKVAQMEQFNRAIPPLFVKAVKLMFGNDMAAFVAYLHESEMLFQVLQNTELDTRQVLFRHDAVFSQHDLKLLEVNAGATIGGWQVGWLEPQFKQVFAQFPETANWAVHYRNAVDSMLAAMFSAVEATKPHAMGNVLFVVAEQDKLDDVMFLNAFSSAYNRMRPACFSYGKVLICNNWADLSFSRDGSLKYRDDEVDVVLLTLPEGVQIPQALFVRMMGANLSKKLVMPDNMIYTFLGNKSLLAVCHEPKVMAGFTEEERAFVKRHLPYTSTMYEKEITWQSEVGLLSVLASQYKDQFVIKKSHSMQGRDVYVGRYCSQAEWQEVLARYLNVDDWLLQEYCAPDLSLAPDHAGNLIEYAFVWGIFDAGGRYGGGFVRGMPVSNEKGVINSATGATEFAIFEEAQRKSKIKL